VYVCEREERITNSSQGSLTLTLTYTHTHTHTPARPIGLLVKDKCLHSVEEVDVLHAAAVAVSRERVVNVYMCINVYVFE
jgi:hypothetical protein